MYTLSSKVDDIPEALSIYINQLVYAEKRKGIDIITLSLGEAFFDIPQYSFDEIDFVKGYHYSDSQGLPELRNKIVSYYNERYGAKIPGINNVLISCGSKAIIFMIMQLIINYGDEVLIHEPAWLSYQEQAKLAGGTPRFIPYDCNIKRFDDYISDKTRLLILNNPNNPAGWVYNEKTLRFLCEQCRKRDIFILMDEAYSDFVDEKGHFVSLSSIVTDYKGIFIVNSLSKNMGMSGWRIGYTISDIENIEKLLKLNQHIITCAPTILQMYMSRYFDDIISMTIPQVKEIVKKRKRIIEYLDSKRIKHLDGESTFYIFIKIENLEVTMLDFCLYLLLKYGIATVPGEAYGRSTKDFIRIGIGAESEERIRYACDVIKMVYEEKKTDIQYVNRRLNANGFYRFKEV